MGKSRCFFQQSGRRKTCNRDGGQSALTISFEPNWTRYAPPYTAFTFSTSYATVSALTTNYPNSTSYQFAISGGALGSQSASLVSPASNLFPAIPYFSGSTYSQAQGMNSSLPFTFAWNGFSVAGGAVNLELAYFTVARISDGQVAYSTVKGNGAGSVTLPANSLQPNTSYNATLIYDARIEQANAGFNGATSEVAFDQRVNLTFATVPEPPSIVLAVFGLVGMAFWRRRTRTHLPTWTI
jgi:PEP-CTERM motif